MKFLRCEICGNIVGVIKEKAGTVTCCGEEMKEIVPQTADSTTEKHVPIIEVEGNKVTVTVGSTIHPMTEAHFIEWIALETKNGHQRIILTPNDQPIAVFYIADDDEVVAAYEYCNIHSLWKA